MLNTKFADWPSYTQEDCELITDVLMSNKVNYWTGGKCKEFEEKYCEFSDASYAISLSNGTVAIEVALRALDVGVGDEVIVTSRSYVASVTPVLTVGAIPIFADVDLNSQNISVETIQSRISSKTKAIIVVHLSGHPAEMDEIVKLADLHDLKIIEDCAQAHGGLYRGAPVGKCGDIATWSFCQDKIITTGGEGGMVTTDSELYWKRMWAYKDHGKSYDSVVKPRARSNEFRWLHDSVGSNFRMTEIQAALGIVQLKRMPDWHASRVRNARRIWSACKDSKWFRVPNIPDHVEHAAYKAYVFIRLEGLPRQWNQENIISEFNLRGVPVSSGGCPEIYREKLFSVLKDKQEIRLPNSKALGETSIMFLVHPTLTSEQIDKTCEVIRDIDSCIG